MPLTTNDVETLGLVLLACLWCAFLLGLALYLGWAAGSRALPRPTARHRRDQPRGDWYYERDEEAKMPSPLPAGVFGFAPTGPRGRPSWDVPTREVTQWR